MKKDYELLCLRDYELKCLICSWVCPPLVSTLTMYQWNHEERLWIKVFDLFMGVPTPYFNTHPVTMYSDVWYAHGLTMSSCAQMFDMFMGVPTPCFNTHHVLIDKNKNITENTKTQWNTTPSHASMASFTSIIYERVRGEKS